MNAELADLVAEQEADALDDGFPYEQLYANNGVTWHDVGWCAPTPFQVVLFKELLTALVNTYGWNGHWLLREIGQSNLMRPDFVEKVGIMMFHRLFHAAVAALPDDVRAGFEDRAA